MKILVTGGLGFIGSNFILKTLSKNDNVSIVNVDNESFGSNLMNLKEIEYSKNYEFIKGDITNYELISKLVDDSDVVVNFAAESHVDRSISNAKSFVHSNIIGVHVILEAIKKYDKKLIHISTDEVFGSLNSQSADENFRFNPSSPYSASKASAEHLVNSFYVTYDCKCVITRCTNNYGPRQFPEKLIPKIILYANNNKKIPMYGTGKNIRDWIHVSDHCDAIYQVLKKGKIGSSYNISSDNEINNKIIIKKILSLMNKSENMIEHVKDRPGHDFRYSMNSLKIKKELGWFPKIKFDEGIENTIKWYLENKEWWKNIPQESLIPK
jgi:dTDP-glucose 4,6-dehydratase